MNGTLRNLSSGFASIARLQLIAYSQLRFRILPWVPKTILTGCRKSMNQIKTLEKAAIKAFRSGQSWDAYWQQHGADVRQIEPYNTRNFGRLYRRLMHMVLCGDTDGMTPIDDGATMPWIADDEVNKPDDCRTNARCLWMTGSST
jgi:hypothetical protein